MFHLSTSLLFLTTWKGGDVDKARGSFRSTTPLGHGQRAGNLERWLVPLKVEIHHLNRLVKDMDQKTDLGAWEPQLKQFMTWLYSIPICDTLLCVFLNVLIAFSIHIPTYIVQTQALYTGCLRSNSGSATFWLCELGQTEVLVSPAVKMRFNGSYFLENLSRLPLIVGVWPKIKHTNKQTRNCSGKY